MEIISRATWGARYGRGFASAPLPAREVWLHHSATAAPDPVSPFDDDAEAVRRLEEIGQDRFGGGISYTFVITPAGRVYEGHGVDRRGAHTRGHNTVGRAICWVGNYERDRPADAMVDATVSLLRHGYGAGWWDASRLDGGHRDVKATLCPGRHAYALIGDINWEAGEHRPSPSPSPSSGGHRMLLVRDPMMHGADVRDLQRGLNGVFPAYSELVVDGWYGPATARAVREFQARSGLAADGIVGPRSWAELSRYGIG